MSMRICSEQDCVQKILGKEFPKISFDFFGFAREHKCMIRMWFEDHSFIDPVTNDRVDNYVLYLDVVKRGLQHRIAIRLFTDCVNSVDGVIETELESAVAQLEKKWRLRM